jgi:hypothetical protein
MMADMLTMHQFSDRPRFGDRGMACVVAPDRATLHARRCRANTLTSGFPCYSLFRQCKFAVPRRPGIGRNTLELHHKPPRDAASRAEISKNPC